ncbi:MAG: hypothetical protein D6820_17065, partial [Lentisphaerae bacterium]
MRRFKARTPYSAPLCCTRIYHGAGQDAGAYLRYSLELAPWIPCLGMYYMGLNQFREHTTARRIWTHLLYEWEAFPWTVIPQIGLSMTRDGEPHLHYEDRVARGEFDHALDLLAEGLSRWGRPFFLRIGYEFNGHWNGYQPADYRAAFQRVARRIREST